MTLEEKAKEYAEKQIELLESVFNFDDEIVKTVLMNFALKILSDKEKEISQLTQDNADRLQELKEKKDKENEQLKAELETEKRTRLNYSECLESKDQLYTKQIADLQAQIEKLNDKLANITEAVFVSVSLNDFNELQWAVEEVREILKEN